MSARENERGTVRVLGDSHFDAVAYTAEKREGKSRVEQRQGKTLIILSTVTDRPSLHLVSFPRSPRGGMEQPRVPSRIFGTEGRSLPPNDLHGLQLVDGHLLVRDVIPYEYEYEDQRYSTVSE